MSTGGVGVEAHSAAVVKGRGGDASTLQPMGSLRDLGRKDPVVPAPSGSAARRRSSVLTSFSGHSLGNRIVASNWAAADSERLPRTTHLPNKVITAHYTPLTFAPVFLWQQFSRFANAYFLVVCVLQTLKPISITEQFPSSAVPLVSVLTFDALITILEDYARHQDDKRANNREVDVMRDGKSFQRTKWQDVQVGDLLRVTRGQIFAADMVFLRAFSEDGSSPQQCYVQTAQLDGETNLKLKQSLASTADMLVDDGAAANFRGIVECEAPNQHFSKFSGTLRMSTVADNGILQPSQPLEADQLLLRGTVLRNVSHVYGLVVYTGVETKVHVSQAEQTYKRARVESVINTNVILLVCLLMLVGLFSTIGYAIWSSANGTHDYLMLEDSVSFVALLQKFGTFFLLNNAFVPVSLYVSMRMVRTIQKLFFEWDRKMYHEDAPTIAATNGAEGHFPCKVRNMELNDELGQVSQVFSDKTGTFTLNYMEFRKFCVNGVEYGKGTTLIGLDRMKREGIECSHLEAELKANDDQPRVIAHVNFVDGSDSEPARTLLQDRQDSLRGQGRAVHDFLLSLALNHSVIPETLRDEEGNVTGTQLSASSPDEEAFVNAGSVLGYKFVTRSMDKVTLHIGDQESTFIMLHTLAYTPARKSMSVIVRSPDGAIYVLMKGADSAIMPRLRNAVEDAEQAARDKTNDLLNSWGDDGLRTLVFGYRQVDEAEYEAWSAQYSTATGSLEQIQLRKAGKPNEIDRLMGEMEKELVLQGATANEDKLQPGVPDTIAALAEGGIKTWMLTGDKRETACNIGYSTRMLTVDMELISFTKGVVDPNDFAKVLKTRAQETYDRMNGGGGRPVALVIDDIHIDRALDPKHPELQDALLQLATCASAVICCRCRPDQKAGLVRLVRRGRPGDVTLAIGDGANDVDMIQTAHIGVGIAGAEGVQAANAADYAIGRFKFLARLLFVHGRWNYRRMSLLVCYIFYKNVAFVMSQYWISLFCGWSGQKFYIEWANQLTNVTFTGVPILLLAIADQDVSDKLALAFPTLYLSGPAGKLFNNRIFWGWIATAFVESIMCFFSAYLSFSTGPSDGATPYVYEFGTLVFHSAICMTTLRFFLELRNHHWFIRFWAFLSVSSMVFFFFMFDSFNSNRSQGMMQRVYGAARFWFVLVLVTWTTQMRRAVMMAFKRLLYPEFSHIVQEVQLITHDEEKLARLAEDPEVKRSVMREGSTSALPIGDAEITTPGSSSRRQVVLSSYGNSEHNVPTPLTEVQLWDSACSSIRESKALFDTNAEGLAGPEFTGFRWVGPGTDSFDTQRRFFNEGKSVPTAAFSPQHSVGADSIASTTRAMTTTSLG